VLTSCHRLLPYVGLRTSSTRPGAAYTRFNLVGGIIYKLSTGMYNRAGQRNSRLQVKTGCGEP
jgi:hypothetical protein